MVREQFEAWARERRLDIDGSYMIGGAWRYYDQTVSLCWEAWQIAFQQYR